MKSERIKEKNMGEKIQGQMERERDNERKGSKRD